MTCNDCLHTCYTSDVENAEEVCNMFLDKAKYVERKRDHWIDGAFENSKKCPVCGKYATKIHTYSEPVFNYKFCPYCGSYLTLED